MIIGIGTDIVMLQRIAEVVERHGERFPQKVLSESEFSHYVQHHDPVAYLAKRFAAKEAAAKAMGTGIGRVAWHDLEVSNDSEGAPILSCHGTARERMQQLGANRVHLSLSDEKDHAIAFVILEA